MRKAVTIVGAVVAVIVLVVAAVFLYAARNLNSIIAERQAYLLQRVSDSLNRKVEVSAIKVSLGWGLMADLTGLKIWDDPAVSDQPFLQTSDAYAKVDLLPLLSRHIDVTEVTLKNPEVRIIRTEQGDFNVATIGKKAGGENEQTAPEPPRADELEGAPVSSEQGNAAARPKKGGGENLGAIYVNSVTIENGVIVYEERGPNHQTATIKDFDVSVKDFAFSRPFNISLTLALLSDKQNIDISGTLGPMLQEGALDVKNASFSIEAKVGPLDVARLRAIGSIGKAIPDALSVPDPVSLEAKADGTLSAFKFHVESDLGADRVAWGESFNKPASVTFNISADGSRSATVLEIAEANLKLGDLDAKLHNIKFGEEVMAHIDTNRFDIGSLAKMLPVLQKYNASGHAEVHSDLQISNHHPHVQGQFVKQLANLSPRANGTISVADVSLSRPDDTKTLVSNLSGVIKLNGNSFDTGPLKFDLGSGHATANMRIDYLQPLQASYSLNIDTLKVAEFAPKRPLEEHLNNVSLGGTVMQRAELAIDMRGSSSDGNLANIGFKDLSLAATLLGNELNVQSLKVGAFNGAIMASGNATLSDPPEFALNLTATNVDIQSALQSQESKSADMIQGILDAQLRVSGKGAKLDVIKPTLAGNGRASVHDGKLIGVNFASEALKKTNGIPGLGDLVPENVVKRHPELSTSPDTDIQNAALSFVLQGPRIITHDLVVQTPDYGMTGNGWFDMDKNIEMAVHVLLTKQLTHEVITEKKNVVYVTNKEGEVDIPMLVRGTLPKPLVLPDVAELAQRAASHALERNVGKLFGKKGKGSNPLDQLKGLFH